MPGGFLMGLGQGLQGLGGIVGGYQQQVEKDKILAEDQRRWTLEQELADKARRDQANRWGVQDMNQQAAQMQQQEQFQKNLEAEKSFRNNSYGLDLMKLDHAAMTAAQEAESQKHRDESYRIMANNQGGGQNARYDRMIDEQRLIQGMAPMTAELKEIMSQLEDPFGIKQGMPNPGDDALRERAAFLRTQIDAMQAELRKRLIPGAVDAALSGIPGGGGNASVAPPGSIPKRAPGSPF